MLNEFNIIGQLIYDDIYRQVAASISARVPDAARETIEKLATTQARKQAQMTISGLVNTELEKVGNIIADGMEAGLHPYEIARQLDAVKGLDPSRAATFEKARKEWEESGMSAAEIARKEEKLYNKLLKERRETIAVTESRNAMEEANALTAQENGAKWKVWQTVGDARVSDICQGNEAQGPIELDAEFASGDAHPPGHPNCRCTVGYIIREDHLLRATERAKERATKTEAAKKGDE
jgi:SPP1 gp7 family putative phage head morphogenesis protein